MRKNIFPVTRGSIKETIGIFISGSPDEAVTTSSLCVKEIGVIIVKIGNFSIAIPLWSVRIRVYTVSGIPGSKLWSESIDVTDISSLKQHLSIVAPIEP